MDWLFIPFLRPFLSDGGGDWLDELGDRIKEWIRRLLRPVQWVVDVTGKAMRAAAAASQAAQLAQARARGKTAGERVKTQQSQDQDLPRHQRREGLGFKDGKGVYSGDASIRGTGALSAVASIFFAE